MSQQDDPSFDRTILAAAEALRTPAGVWTDHQVAYLLRLAYDVGRAHAGGEDLAETIACWTRHQPVQVTAEQRVQQRLDDMEKTAGPARYLGGPVPWEGA